ncbi:oligosaccharide flippase family protein [Desulfurococcus mucosus]|uniref:Polysaccharide biosynthesis protein n=1 Tax=Desulfurococcus mucosus (strain ATCC 35584 / DSM 2162 / JCM 9187 / O7/1) TaxID=765177 RepID=E8R8C0_DESM0|nr:oligosaccharide flippase family protein [Desulfurococcus mucosus]ADV64746.1 polysaccharide biosynthesis protein [Desulfurococcus mucosus DSM 2162]
MSRRSLVDLAAEASRGGAYLFAGNALSLALSALASILIARLLGPEGYGIYSLVLTVPAIVGPLIGLGIGQAVTRYVAMLGSEGKGCDASMYIRVALIFEASLGLVAMVLVFLCSDLVAMYMLGRPGIGSLVGLVSPLVLTGSIIGICDGVFLAFLKTKYSALVKSLQALVKLALSPLLALSLGVMGALGGNVASYIVATIASLALLASACRTLGSNNKATSVGYVEALRSMISYAYPLYLPTLLGFLIGRVIFVLTAHFVSDYELGNYSVAQNLYSPISMATSAIGSSLFAVFSGLDPGRESREVAEVFRASVKYSTVLMVPAIAMAILFSRDLVVLVYGLDYEAAPLYLALTATGALGVGLGAYVLGGLFAGIGKTQEVFRSWIVNTLVSLPLTLILLPRLGMVGAIVAGLIGGYASTVYLLMRAKIEAGVSIGAKEIARVYVSAAISALATLPVLYVEIHEVLRVILASIIYVASYAIILPLLGALKEDEVSILVNVARRSGPVLLPLTLLLRIEERIIRKLKQIL